MEAVTTILTTLQPQKWTILIDLKDAHLHIPIAHSSRKDTKIVVDNKVFQNSLIGLVNLPKTSLILLKDSFWESFLIRAMHVQTISRPMVKTHKDNQAVYESNKASAQLWMRIIWTLYMDT